MNGNLYQRGTIGWNRYHKMKRWAHIVSKTKSAFGKKIAAVLEPPADPTLGAGAEKVKGMGDAACSWMRPLRRNGHKLLCISLLGTSLVHLGVDTFHPPMPHSRSRSGDFLQGGRCTRTLSTKASGGGTRLQELCRGATPIALPYGPLECSRPPMLNGTSTFCTRRSVTGSTRNCLSLFQNFWSSRR